MQQNTVLLDDVKSHFEHWRATRTKRGKIPDYLWEKVKLLVGHYSLTTITETLSINTKQMREHLDIGSTASFIEVSTEIASPSTLPSSLSASMVDKTEICAIEIHHTNGSILKINALPVASLTTVITQFIG